MLYRYITPQGVGLTNDSAAYLGGARSLLNGQGYIRFSGDRLPRPITQFPPLLSLTIAVFAKIGATDVFTAAKTLNLLCYLLNLILLMIFLKHAGGRNLILFWTGVLYLCCTPFLQAHAYGLSEALFMVFLFGTWLLTLRLICKPVPFLSSLGLGIWIGLATLTRYAGAAILISVLFFWAFNSEVRRRGGKTFSGLLIGFALPIVPWMLRNARAAESVANRGVFFHPPSASVINEGIETLSGFFLPERGGWITKGLPLLRIMWILLIAVAVLLLILRLFKQAGSPQEPSPADSAITITALFALVYLLFLIGVALFIDGSTVFDNRMLLPFFCGVIAFILSIAAKMLAAHPRPLRRQVAVNILLALFALLLAEDEMDLVRSYHQDGQGFAGSDWSEMEITRLVDALPTEATYFSNRQTYLWLMKNRPSYILPALADAATRQQNETFEADRQWMKQEILSGKAYAVVFNYPALMENPADRLWLERLFEGIPVLKETHDGTVFGIE